MKFYLLTGAGFSCNWGGWLASETFEYLLGEPAVISSTEVETLLWEQQATGGFEAALDELQRDTAPDAGTRELQLRSAVLRMFDVMSAAFKFKPPEVFAAGDTAHTRVTDPPFDEPVPSPPNQQSTPVTALNVHNLFKVERLPRQSTPLGIAARYLRIGDRPMFRADDCVARPLPLLRSHPQRRWALLEYEASGCRSCITC